MTITMSGENFFRIMEACKPSTNEDDRREPLQHIEIFHDGNGTAYATALDGYVMNQVRVPCRGDAGTVYLRPCEGLSEWDEITITQDGETVSVSDDMTTITRKALKAADVNRQKIAANRMEKQMKYRIAVDPDLLRKGLEAISPLDRCIVLEFSGKLDGIVLRGHDACSIVLPMRYGAKEINRLAHFYGQKPPEKPKEASQ